MALTWHNQLLAEHGGAPGLRDEGLLESSLARPRNLLAYGGARPSLTRLAAAYASGIVRNHPFIDGNKRVALVVAFTFLDLNGVDITAEQEDAFLALDALASGQMSEAEFADWLENNSKRRGRSIRTPHDH